ncbi:hypothetical protein DTO027I6_10001 [Penicillium roqueforti]|nr:hypothetical protein CBS147337_10125 [Penicillium roqueforti]KAI3184244.1 hypothetical protein DTO027I6_10001 [Penicillium roqueforti]
MKVLALIFILAGFVTAVPVASYSSKHLRLLVQQEEHLGINENTIAAHDTVLYTVIHDTGLETVRVQLCHGHIDVNLKSQWLEDPSKWAAKGRHLPTTTVLVVDGRWNVRNLKRSLYYAQNHCIWRAIQSTTDRKTRQPSLMPSPRRRTGGF